MESSLNWGRDRELTMGCKKILFLDPQVDFKPWVGFRIPEKYAISKRCFELFLRAGLGVSWKKVQRLVPKFCGEIEGELLKEPSTAMYLGYVWPSVRRRYSVSGVVRTYFRVY